MRKLLLLPALVFALGFAVSLQAQELDLGLGFGTLKAPAASTNSSTSIFFPSLSGGLYTSFSGTVRLKHFIGFNAEAAWRTRQAVYGGVQPYRPLFYDFNADYGKTWHKKVGADVMAGIGAESLRFYTPYYTCGFTSCSNYQSINHFAFHIGGDLRYYVWHGVFIRPEAHYYIIHNNNEFNKVNASRFAIAIGYSFLPGL
ncbi:MAG TPA: hypothetical protein VF133_06375 [Terriglobales bacterium]